MILLARTNPDAQRKYDGLSFFLAPMNVPGIDTVPIRKLTGEYGFTETFFTDARIPADADGRRRPGLADRHADAAV